MKDLLFKLLGRVSDLADVEPLIALFLGAALLAVLPSTFLHSNFASDPAGTPSLCKA